MSSIDVYHRLMSPMPPMSYIGSGASLISEAAKGSLKDVRHTRPARTPGRKETTLLLGGLLQKPLIGVVSLLRLEMDVLLTPRKKGRRHPC
jgi:hypothetical protein